MESRTNCHGTSGNNRKRNKRGENSNNKNGNSKGTIGIVYSKFTQVILGETAINMSLAFVLAPVMISIRLWAFGTLNILLLLTFGQ